MHYDGGNYCIIGFVNYSFGFFPQHLNYRLGEFIYKYRYILAKRVTRFLTCKT